MIYFGMFCIGVSMLNIAAAIRYNSVITSIAGWIGVIILLIFGMI